MLLHWRIQLRRILTDISKDNTNTPCRFYRALQNSPKCLMLLTRCRISNTWSSWIWRRLLRSIGFFHWPSTRTRVNRHIDLDWNIFLNFKNQNLFSVTTKYLFLSSASGKRNLWVDSEQSMKWLLDKECNRNRIFGRPQIKHFQNCLTHYCRCKKCWTQMRALPLLKQQNWMTCKSIWCFDWIHLALDKCKVEEKRFEVTFLRLQCDVSWQTRKSKLILKIRISEIWNF